MFLSANNLELTDRSGFTSNGRFSDVGSNITDEELLKVIPALKDYAILGVSLYVAVVGVRLVWFSTVQYIF